MYLTRKLHVTLGIESNPVTIAVVCYISVIFLLSLLIFTAASGLEAGWHNFTNNQWRLNWSKDQPGYTLHIICTAIEWIGIVLCGSILYLCLFRRIKNFQEWHKVQF